MLYQDQQIGAASQFNYHGAQNNYKPFTRSHFGSRSVARQVPAGAEGPYELDNEVRKLKFKTSVLNKSRNHNKTPNSNTVGMYATAQIPGNYYHAAPANASHSRAQYFTTSHHGYFSKTNMDIGRKAHQQMNNWLSQSDLQQYPNNSKSMYSGLGSNAMAPTTTKDSLQGGYYYKDGEENRDRGSGMRESYAARGSGLNNNNGALQEIYDSQNGRVTIVKKIQKYSEIVLGSQRSSSMLKKGQSPMLMISQTTSNLPLLSKAYMTQNGANFASGDLQSNAMYMTESYDKSGKDGCSPDNIVESKLSPTIIPLRSKETYLKKRLSKDSMQQQQRKFKKQTRDPKGNARVDDSSSYLQFQTQKTFNMDKQNNLVSGIETNLIKSINSQAVSQANEKETVDVVVKTPMQKAVKAVYLNNQNAPAVTVSGTRGSGVGAAGIISQAPQTSNRGNSMRLQELGGNMQLNNSERAQLQSQNDNNYTNGSNRNSVNKWNCRESTGSSNNYLAMIKQKSSTYESRRGVLMFQKQVSNADLPQYHSSNPKSQKKYFGKVYENSPVVASVTDLHGQLVAAVEGQAKPRTKLQKPTPINKSRSRTTSQGSRDPSAAGMESAEADNLYAPIKTREFRPYEQAPSLPKATPPQEASIRNSTSVSQKKHSNASQNKIDNGFQNELLNQYGQRKVREDEAEGGKGELALVAQRSKSLQNNQRILMEQNGTGYGDLAGKGGSDWYYNDEQRKSQNPIVQRSKDAKQLDGSLKLEDFKKFEEEEMVDVEYGPQEVQGSVLQERTTTHIRHHHQQLLTQNQLGSTKNNKQKRMTELSVSGERDLEKRYHQTETIFTQHKPSGFLSQKILEPNQSVLDRMNIISNLFGNNKEARALKQDFLRIAVVNGAEADRQMVRGRGVGRERRSVKWGGLEAEGAAAAWQDEQWVGMRKKDDSLFQGFGRFESDDCSSRFVLGNQGTERGGNEELMREAGGTFPRFEKSSTLLANLAKNGSAAANYDPIKSIHRVIMREKPNIEEACRPHPLIKKQSQVNPCLQKKLVKIEDVVQRMDLHTERSRSFSSFQELNPLSHHSVVPEVMASTSGPVTFNKGALQYRNVVQRGLKNGLRQRAPEGGSAGGAVGGQALHPPTNCTKIPQPAEQFSDRFENHSLIQFESNNPILTLKSQVEGVGNLADQAQRERHKMKYGEKEGFGDRAEEVAPEQFDAIEGFSDENHQEGLPDGPLEDHDPSPINILPKNKGKGTPEELQYNIEGHPFYQNAFGKKDDPSNPNRDSIEREGTSSKKRRNEATSQNEQSETGALSNLAVSTLKKDVNNKQYTINETTINENMSKANDSNQFHKKKTKLKPQASTLSAKNGRPYEEHQCNSHCNEAGANKDMMILNCEQSEGHMMIADSVIHPQAAAAGGSIQNPKLTIKPVNLNQQALMGMNTHKSKNSKMSLLELQGQQREEMVAPAGLQQTRADAARKADQLNFASINASLHSSSHSSVRQRARTKQQRQRNLPKLLNNRSQVLNKQYQSNYDPTLKNAAIPSKKKSLITSNNNFNEEAFRTTSLLTGSKLTLHEHQVRKAQGKRQAKNAASKTKEV